jgi:subtilase family serine protease
MSRTGSRARKLVAITGATAAVAAMTIVGASGLSAASPRPADVPLAGSAASFTSHARVTGTIAGSRRLTVQVWLRPREAAAARFARAVSTPGSRLFHHYLSPAGYTARFGASRAGAARVQAWLRRVGFTAVHTDAQRDYVRATAATAKIDAAFHTRLKLYRSSARINAGPYRLRANDSAVSVPRSLARFVLGVTGLDNAAPYLPIDRPNARSGAHPGAAKTPKIPCSQYYGQHTVSGLPRQLGTTSFATDVCGYSGAQLRSVYGANDVNTGKGQTIALIELGLTQDMFLTLQDYAAAFHLPAPSTQRYSELSLGNGSACGDPFDIEEQIDVEASYDMAPGANQLVVGGDSCNFGDYGLQGLFDADIAVLNGNGGHPLASAASNSWEGFDETQPVNLTSIENAYLVRAAAEGVGMYFSSGDGSGVATPSDNPLATAVGGTTLGIGKTGGRLFETGWSTNFWLLVKKAWVNLGEQGAAGGGPSLLWKEPGYQKGVVPAALATAPGNRGGRVRSVPDISADADPFTGMAVGLLSFPKNKPPKFEFETYGGTSVASPLVAGMVTAAQQGQPTPFGQLNPVFYKLVGTSAVSDTLPLTSHSPVLWRGVACGVKDCGAVLLTRFDDQSFRMEGYTGQVTLKGYDNMTGVGTPNGQKFIAALRKLAG